MNYEFRTDWCILVGDTHSLNAAYDILNIDIPNGSDVVHVGDVGLGFGERVFATGKSLEWLDKCNTLCQKLDINFYVIRGNHDATYNELWDTKWSNIFLIKDFAYGCFPNGKKMLFIGGGVSVDRFTRRVDSDYWADEATLYLNKVDKVDIIFSHDAPEYFNHSTDSLPRSYGWYCDKDPTLMEDCLKQRLNISDITERSGAKTIFGGHFHNSYRQEINGVYYRCLDINERFEFDSNKEYKL